MQRLDEFVLPKGFRGASAIKVQLWWIVQATVFAWSPQIFYPWRRLLLRCFGAQVGSKVLIRASVKVTYPWKLSIGDYAWIGDDVHLYSLGEISIGEHSVISQKSYICAADHDVRSSQFRIRASGVTVGKGAWVATDVFVAPGVTINSGCVVGSRSSVFSDMPAETVCYGSPCRPIRPRMLSEK